MALSLKNLKSSKSTIPDRFMFHGPEGMGKTSLASEWPDPLYIATQGERTPAGVEMATTDGVVDAFESLMALIAELYEEEHDFKTVIIDSTDGIEPLIWKAVCKQQGWDSIEQPGYGKGYVEADSYWRGLMGGLDALRSHRNMTVILIAHTGKETVEEPGYPSFARYGLKIHKRAVAMLMEWTDYVFFINGTVEIKKEEAGFNKKHTHAEGGGSRFIHTDARPWYAAKNRGDGMPPKIPFSRGKGYSEVAKYLGNKTADEAA